jgi:hypothetical protein
MNTDIPNRKVNRRRRRPPRSADRRPPEREAERNDDRPAEKTAERPPERPPERRAERTPAARREQSAPAPLRHRGEPRRRPARSGSEPAAAGDPLPELTRANSGAADPPISPLDANIFIYTYTLRPKSLLESYQPGPTRTERMEFENTTTL